ncbi:hypothetical protein BDK51DRAFT_33519 [Blyttiomyces helicus]|uniref:Amino acid permease/ SLC12A domain-containing protein n=1 Tax=Blyttiomyces helicus TaxID=388810 RepID=A0A4P9W162_9FUNG|nr:hypothetical protein BDK51DRAFT_33519 [Blyttiomyces helicus]|eukprot:RKO84438.1 hypothetical protein BDK51DRAFT_33519 [Blyttiomyces helicus]
MISRALGKEVGGSAGMLFYLANVIGPVMYAAGMVEILTTYISPTSSFGDPQTDVRVYGSVVLVLVALVAAVGSRVVSEATIVFVVAIVVALVFRRLSYSGVTGFPGNFVANLQPGYIKPDMNGQFSDETFFGMFGVFFPSVTGVMAGASRPSNLRNAERSIPRGTIAAHLTTSFARSSKAIC